MDYSSLNIEIILYNEYYKQNSNIVNFILKIYFNINIFLELNKFFNIFKNIRLNSNS